jgi:hypothetical protein
MSQYSALITGTNTYTNKNIKESNPNRCLVIPRVFPNINEARIKRIFQDLKLGYIDHIDIVAVAQTKEDGKQFNKVFVHFSSWFTNDTAQRAVAKLEKGDEIKIIYDEPWFWKVSAYREKKEEPTQISRSSPRPNIKSNQKQKPMPVIAFDAEEDNKDKEDTEDKDKEKHEIKRSKPNPPRRTSTDEYPLGEGPQYKKKQPQSKSQPQWKNSISHDITPTNQI